MRGRSTSLVFLAGAAVVFAGCSGNGNGAGSDVGTDEPGRFLEFDLFLRAQNIELYPGTVVPAWLFSDCDDCPGTLPGPTIRATEGDTLRINFWLVGAPMPHTIHWHGIHLPWNMDGVPYVSQLPIGDNSMDGGPVLPDDYFTYEFTVHQSGTYFYHCHVDTAHHMDMGMYGALIIDPKDPAHDPPFAREYTLMLDEWDRSHIHDAPTAQTLQDQIGQSGDPETIIDGVVSQLRDYYYNNPNLNPIRENTTLKERRDWYPATYPTYFADYDTFLINGKAFPDTETLLIKSGETIRMRFINAGFQVHAMHLHGHHMKVTHKDGYLLPAPYMADTILIGPGERYDVYVTGDNPGPWMLHDHIALNEMNDHTNPGGMMTMLCYEDGWEPIPEVGNSHCAHGSLSTAGEVVQLQAELLGRQLSHH